MPWYQVISTMITIILGTVAFGSLTMGYFLCPTTIYEWIVYAIATLILFFPHTVTWVLGVDLPTFIESLIHRLPRVRHRVKGRRLQQRLSTVS